MKPRWLRAFSLIRTSFVVGPKQLSGTKVHSHGHLCFQWMAIFCKWKAVVPRSIQWVQNFDLMELEFNFGPNYQKDNLTQPAAIKPCCCLSIKTCIASRCQKWPIFAQCYSKASDWLAHIVNRSQQELGGSWGNWLSCGTSEMVGSMAWGGPPSTPPDKLINPLWYVHLDLSGKSMSYSVGCNAFSKMALKQEKTTKNPCASERVPNPKMQLIASIAFYSPSTTFYSASPLFSPLLGYYGQRPHTNGKGEGAELSVAAPQMGAFSCTESHSVGKAACLHGKGGSGDGLPSELRLRHFTEAKSWKQL